MNYYICGYNHEKIIISKPLKKEKKIVIFDNKILKNVIESNTVFDFSLSIKNREEFIFFVVCSKDYDKVYNFLVRHRNTKLFNNMNIFLTFNIEINNNNFYLNKVYYEINREYPFKKYLYNILINILPPELILMIYKYLDREVVVSFIVNKARYNNNYYLSMPKIFY